MTDADEMYQAAEALRKEADDHHKNLLQLQSNGQLKDEVLAGAVVDTAGLLVDTTTRLANVLSPEAAEGDDEDDDGGDDDVEIGLEPEEAATLRRLLKNYAALLEGALQASPEGPAREQLLVDQRDIPHALELVHSLELVEDA